MPLDITANILAVLVTKPASLPAAPPAPAAPTGARLGHARTPVAGAGVVLLGTALIVWMINWMFRMSVESNRDREQEEEARTYFDEHGRWPDE